MDRALRWASQGTGGSLGSRGDRISRRPPRCVAIMATTIRHVLASEAHFSLNCFCPRSTAGWRDPFSVRLPALDACCSLAGEASYCLLTGGLEGRGPTVFLHLCLQVGRPAVLWSDEAVWGRRACWWKPRCRCTHYPGVVQPESRCEALQTSGGSRAGYALVGCITNVLIRSVTRP